MWNTTKLCYTQHFKSDIFVARCQTFIRWGENVHQLHAILIYIHIDTQRVKSLKNVSCVFFSFLFFLLCNLIYSTFFFICFWSEWVAKTKWKKNISELVHFLWINWFINHMRYTILFQMLSWIFYDFCTSDKNPFRLDSIFNSLRNNFDND